MNTIENVDSKVRTINPLKNWWQRLCQPEVIQIGVGGTTSCGKTVLIDAMFGILDVEMVPDYLPNEPFKNNRSLNCDNDIFNGSYFTYEKLRKEVTNKFHEDNQTQDDGSWNFKTYWANLKCKRKKRILLIRNLPGEMFDDYFSEAQGAAKTNTDTNIFLDGIFDNFLGCNTKIKKVLSDIFTLRAYGNKTKQKIDDIKTEFFDYIEQTYPSIYNKRKTDFDVNTGSIPKHFCAYLFYKSSQINVLCFKSSNTTNIEKTQNTNMNNAKGIKCFTQFDTLLKNENSILFGNNKNYDKYAEIMSSIYSDIKNKEDKIIDKNKWENKGIKEENNSFYLASVNYYLSEDKFYYFLQDKTKTNKWDIPINCHRTSLGVFELVYYILSQCGIRLKKSKLDDVKYNEFLKKTGEK
ncbi:MAG: hypothetical protein LBS01_00890 [Prevotellaceae bacterium]|jgi:hypothetical protein|nr:hypothetical protein [Prevotellaceae bacterium]